MVRGDRQSQEVRTHTPLQRQRRHLACKRGRYMSERAKYISGDVYAVQHVTEAAKLPAPLTAEGCDFGIFLECPQCGSNP